MPMTPAPSAETIKYFFELLYPDVENGWLVLSYADHTRLTPQGKPRWCSDWFDLAKTTWPAITRTALARTKHHDLYFSVVLQRPNCEPGQFKRSRNATAYLVPGLWFDIDLACGQHAVSQLPSTAPEALQFLTDLPGRPSLLVHSGGGLHAYWLFKEPYVITAAAEHEAIGSLARQFTYTIVMAGKEYCWTLDAVGDLARVLRPPGTINHKYSTCVELLHEGRERYNPSDFDWLLALPAPLRATHAGQGVTGQPDLVTIATHYGTVLERKSQTELAGAHPQHGSSTGSNFNVNPAKGLWHCWRHGTGGDALSLIAVCEGLLDCEGAVSGALTGELFTHVVTIANEQFQAGIEMNAHRRELGVPVLASVPWPELSETALYGLAGKVVQTIAPYTEADQAAILIQFLVMFGNLVGRTPHAIVEADRHYLNLFISLVGETSKGRKGVSMGHPRQLLKSVDDVWGQSRIMSGLASGEGLIWNVRDPTYKLGKDDAEECVDEGVEDKRLLVFEPEFARVLRVLSREGNTLSAVIRHAWDDGTLQTMVSGRRVAPVQATGAYVSLIGHITVDELRRNLTETETSNGFANRFLWCCVRRSKLLPEGGMYPQEALAPLARQLMTVVIAARKTGRMHRDEAARTRWAAIYEGLSEGKPGLFGHVTARAEAQVLRLSCIYALLDQSASVTVAHLNAALALWQYCEASAAYIFGDALGDAVADEILQMLRAIAPESMTRTGIYNAFARHKTSATIQQALAVLLRQQLVTCTKEDTTGRSVERWSARLTSAPRSAQNAY